MRFGLLMAAVGACLLISGVAKTEEVNVYWRVDLNQGSYIIAYGQGATEEAAWEDCRRIRAITRAMTSAETRKSNVSAVTTQANRWCKNPMQIATVRPDPVAPPVICTAAPADRVLACPAPTIGSWTQRATVGPPPDCAITWSPLTTPAGACVTPAPSGTAQLTWQDPNPIGFVNGFAVYYGNSPSNLSRRQDVPGTATRTATITGLASGTHYFAVSAYVGGGLESGLSNIAQKVVP